jgi:DNA (cytosine-5)-methyltransferase 1
VRILDLFCAAGGAGMGYARAGFEVVGVDIDPQPRYPFAFVQADALEYLLEHGHEFDAIHASPPCQRWSDAGTSRALGDEHPDLLNPVREILAAGSIPYVLENIMGAPMPESFVLCGTTFGLPIIRHRRFEWNLPYQLIPNACPARGKDRSARHGGTYPYASGSWERAWREHVIPAVWPWMNAREAGLAIPPAYTEWLGGRILVHLAEQAA